MEARPRRILQTFFQYTLPLKYLPIINILGFYDFRCLINFPKKLLKNNPLNIYDNSLPGCGLTELDPRRHLCPGYRDHPPLPLLPEGLPDNARKHVKSL
jgi:hypothetical protein